MKIESFTIKNYRSIKALRLDNLNPVNVFFGKNNVGKSNILRALHLAFYSLKNDELYLPDTMFYKRNLYKPIEITLDLILEKDFFNQARARNSLDKAIENLRSAIAGQEEIIEDGAVQIEEFIEKSSSFHPVEKLRLNMLLDYNEETSDIRFSIKDLESGYVFDYGKYRILYKKLEKTIGQKMASQRERAFRDILRELSSLGVDVDEVRQDLSRIAYLPDYRADFRRIVRDIRIEILRLEGHINATIKDPEKRHRALSLLAEFRHISKPTDGVSEPISTVFNTVKEFFEKISDNFILIPNKEYLAKGPFDEKNGDLIEIFDTNKFKDRLLSLIESPNKKERKLIQQFNSVFSKSYGDLGELEIRRFREEVFAILDTGFTALPIENQGLGIQDLFLYLTHMILFNSAIIAIEEPEGGLSTANQRILRKIIAGLNLASDKQIFISSHSEDFETPNSYIIEMDENGTREISRIKDEKDYEKKIDGILLKRKLMEEKEQYEALLKEVTERQVALDILNYVDKLDDKETLDPEKISNELGYKKEKVEEILRDIAKRRA